MNLTKNCAIKAIPYKVVFNRKPRFKRLDVANCHFTEADIEEYIYDDDQDDFLMAEDREGQQLGAWSEPWVRKSGGISEIPNRSRVEEEEDSTGSEDEENSQKEQQSEDEGSEEEESGGEASKEENTFEPTIETEDELLPENPTDLDAINTYFARINTPDSDKNESKNDLTDPPPSTSPSHPLDDNLQALSPQMQSLKLNSDSLQQAAESSRSFRAHIHAYQLHANERSICQYGKQRAVKAFAIGDKVSIAVPALDRASTDDKRIFGRVIKSFDNAYSIQTKYGVLDRNYPTFELMALPDTIELGIPEPPPSKKITLHTVAAKESNTETVLLHCNVKMSGHGVWHVVAHVWKRRWSVVLHVTAVKMYMAVPPVRIFFPPVHEGKRDWRFEIGKRRRRRVRREVNGNVKTQEESW